VPLSRRLVCVELLSQKQNKIDGLMYSERGELKQEDKGIGIGRRDRDVNFEFFLPEFDTNQSETSYSVQVQMLQ